MGTPAGTPQRAASPPTSWHCTTGPKHAVGTAPSSSGDTPWGPGRCGARWGACCRAPFPLITTSFVAGSQRTRPESCRRSEVTPRFGQQKLGGCIVTILEYHQVGTIVCPHPPSGDGDVPSDSYPMLLPGVQVDAVVLESPYTNIRDAAANIPITKVSTGPCTVAPHPGTASP